MITRLSPRPSGCPSDITSENFLTKIGTPSRAFFLRSEHASFACSSHTAPFIKKDGFPRRLFLVGRNGGIYACDTTLTRSPCSGPPSALVCRFFGVLRPPERALEPASPRVQSPADYLQKKPPEWWLFF